MNRWIPGVLAICCAACAWCEPLMDEPRKPAYIVLDPNAPRPAATQGEPVPDPRTPPEAPRREYGVPGVRAGSGIAGETVVLSNDVARVELLIDRGKRARMVSLRTGAGSELLAEPASPLVLIDERGSTVKDGKLLVAESWIPRQHTSFAEVEVRLSAPEPVLWRLRLYRDKPYLEQRFTVPDDWRQAGRTLAQVLVTPDSLKPVMPNNVFGRGFSEGRPNLSGRHRFEYVAQSDHLCYDHERRAGLAGFVAGVGGEERVRAGQFAMLDYVTQVLGSGEPTGRFILWPFDGAPERGFLGIRRFVSDEYSAQGDKHQTFSWNQFWLWQGGIQPASSEVVTADRLLDILPHIAGIGCEEFHLDAGWEVRPGDWRFDPKRFPNGFEPLRRFLREHGMRYHTWMNTGHSEDPAVVAALIEQTDLCKLFHDRTVDEKTIAALRQVRDRYPGFETFAHHSTSRSACYWWGNIHYLSDINQIYFGEGEFWAWSNVLPEKPEGDINRRFFSKHSLRAGDLVTRSAAYQVHWAWPFRCVVPPHCGWAWFEDRSLDELASRMFTTIAARADYQWGEDPRMLRPEALKFFLDWTAFFRAARPYLREYQHVLGVPDGVHPDGAAHLVDGSGFVVLCNPSEKQASVDLKELLWEPELELDPSRPVHLSDWTRPLAPTQLQTVGLMKPSGELKMDPLSYRVIGINVDGESMLANVRRERAKLHGPKDAQ